MLRVLPAHQRLHPQQPAGLGVDLGLVVQHQLVVFDGAAQLAEQGQPPGAVLVQPGSNSMNPAWVSLAAYMAMSARCSNSSGSLPCPGYSARPMLASTSKLTPLQRKRLLEGGLELSGDGDRPWRGDLGQQHRELVAPSRATVSTFRRARSRSPTWTRSWSP